MSPRLDPACPVPPAEATRPEYSAEAARRAQVREDLAFLERPATTGLAHREYWAATGEPVCGDPEHRHHGRCSIFESARTRGRADAATDDREWVVRWDHRTRQHILVGPIDGRQMEGLVVVPKASDQQAQELTPACECGHDAVRHWGEYGGDLAHYECRDCRCTGLRLAASVQVERPDEPTSAEVQAAAIALWEAGNERLGVERDREVIGEYVHEAEAALRAAAAARLPGPDDPAGTPGGPPVER